MEKTWSWRRVGALVCCVDDDDDGDDDEGGELCSCRVGRLVVTASRLGEAVFLAGDMVGDGVGIGDWVVLLFLLLLLLTFMSCSGGCSWRWRTLRAAAGVTTIASQRTTATIVVL
jgi:hypothetical protein